MWSSEVLYVTVILSLQLTAVDSCYISTGSGYNDVTDIHIIGFFPCTDPNDTRGIPVDNCDGIDRIPIMKLALEEINERCDLLPGYRLVVDYANSACSSIPAVYHLIQQTDPSQPTKLMILGAACSRATRLMGTIAQKYMHIPQVSYSASYTVFGEDKVNYPRFYRLIPIEKQVVDSYVALVDKLHWKRVAIITHEDEFLYDIGQYVVEKLTSLGVITHATFTDDPSQAIRAIKEFNARIIMTWHSYQVGATVWCMAIKEKLVGPDFVWFVPTWFQRSWRVGLDSIECTTEEMSDALEHSFTADGVSVYDNEPSRVLVSNKTVKQFKDDLNVKSVAATAKRGIYINTGYVYDAVWTIALALNSSISILEERGLGRLEDFTYDSVEMADVFTEAIANVSFEGISGGVSFQKHGDRNKPLINIFQYRDGDAVLISIYNPANGSDSFIDLPGQSFMWQGGYVPRDTPVPEEQGDSQFEVIITIIITSVGILSTIYFSIFNIYYRHHQVVKRSSYRLNALILASAFVGFTGTLLYAVQLNSSASRITSTTICNLRHWMTKLAFVVCFGTLFAKIWRLYKVFFNKHMSTRKYLKDYHLLIMVACIMTPTLLLLIIQAAQFPITLHKHAHVNEDNRAVDKIHYQCEGKHYLLFDAILFTGEVTLGLLSAVLAYKTKKHLPEDRKYQKYHESAVINLSATMALFVSTICEVIIIVFLLNDIRNGILLIVTLRECFWLYPVIYLLYAPKVFRIYFGFKKEEETTQQQQSRSSNRTETSILSKRSSQLSSAGGTGYSQWRRRGVNNKYNPSSLVLSNSSNNPSFESNTFDPSVHTLHKIVEYAPDPDSATQDEEDNVAAAAAATADSNTCAVFVNVEVANETKETKL